MLQEKEYKDHQLFFNNEVVGGAQGCKNANNYNKIASPGDKYRKQDRD